MIAIDTMRANVFQAPETYEITDVERPRPGPGEALIRVTLTTICGTDLHIVGGSTRSDRARHRTRAGRRHRGARRRRDRLRGRRPRAGRCDHALRPMPARACRATSRSAGTAPATRRSAAGASATPSTAPRRSTCSCRGAGQPGQDSRRPHRRAGRAAGRHRVDGIHRRRVGRCPHRRRRRRVRTGSDRPLRDGGREAHGRSAGHRRRRRRDRLAMAKRMGADVALDFTQGRRRRRGEALTRRRRRRRDRGARHPADVRERAPLRFDPAGRCRASASTRASSRCPTTAFAAGLGDHRIVTTLCPGGKERMRRLIAMVQARPLRPDAAAHPPLPARADRARRYRVFGERRDGVLKVAITP